MYFSLLSFNQVHKKLSESATTDLIHWVNDVHAVLDETPRWQADTHSEETSLIFYTILFSSMRMHAYQEFTAILPKFFMPIANYHRNC